MTEELFVVVKRGVYLTGVCGICTTLPDAVILAKDTLRKEHDKYYIAEVYLSPVDSDAQANRVGSVARRDRNGRITRRKNVSLTWKDA